MKKNTGRRVQSGKKELREKTRIVRPPRLEGVVKNAKQKLVKKPKGFHAKSRRVVISDVTLRTLPEINNSDADA